MFSGENTPNWTFLILRNRHFECVKSKLGLDDMLRSYDGPVGRCTNGITLQICKQRNASQLLALATMTRDCATKPCTPQHAIRA